MIGISQPTTYLLSKARFQRNYLWDVLMPDIGPIWGINTQGLVGLSIGQLIQSVEFGDYNIGGNAITMKYGPFQTHYAGLFEVSKIRMTFLKTMPDIIVPYFNAWKDLIVDKAGLYQVKANYQKTIYIRFLDSTGLAVGRYKLLGTFPVNFPSYNLNYEDNGIIKVPVDFEVDKLEYEAF